MNYQFMILAIATFALSVAGQDVIAKDSNGLVVDVMADFGHVSRETCTVVMLTQESFVLVQKNGQTAWYPVPFHSVKVVDHLRLTADPLAAMEKVGDISGGRLH